MSTLIFLHKWSEEERENFIRFCEPYLKGFEKNKLPKMSILIPHYQSDRADFELFMSPHVKRDIRGLKEIIDSYLDRNYLRYMRVDGALKAESANGQRIQPMYETGIDNQLPVVFAEDQFLVEARGPAVATVNAHNFEDVYEADRLLLWKKVPTLASGSTQRTIHNGDYTLQNHTTNAEVEDFIKYLDEEIANEKSIVIEKSSIAGTKVVSIIKQMLGLEPKAQGTRGGFAPYLGHSMYHAKENSPKGDEMLGRVWAYMKNLVNGKTYVTAAAKKTELNDYKKAVVLALVEASEISPTSISTHCQTRTSGELFKLIAWHLPDSKLRPLIAAVDAPTVRTDADPKTRIINAATYARRLFNIMRQEDSGEIKRLREEQLDIDGGQPPLWKLYEAYYDDLYRRTKGKPGDGYEKDANGYRLDEHILTRDGRGNLVSKYQITPVHDHRGKFEFNKITLRQEPLIVYYQAEFQVFEHTFTELMRKEFEEQRGLKY